MAGTRTLVTGAAGFVGFHVARRLLHEGRRVVGVDNLSDYYSVALKKARLAELEGAPNFEFVKADLADRAAVEALFAEGPFDGVVHLAAQPGVRYSLKNPHAYAESNLTGFLNVLEGCRRQEVDHLVFASSSSVYGANARTPYATSDSVDHPISLYAATKKSNELLAHSYAHLYSLPVTGLRFFTVYGPWGRPDMAYCLFAEAIRRGTPIKVFGEGRMKRDMTYVGDIAEGVARVLARPATPDETWDPEQPNPARSSAPYRLYNIGAGRPVALLRFIEVLEEAMGQEAKKEFLPMQPGDVRVTYADTSALEEATGFAPETPLEEGIARFVAWYKAYYESVPQA